LSKYEILRGRTLQREADYIFSVSLISQKKLEKIKQQYIRRQKTDQFFRGCSISPDAWISSTELADKLLMGI